MYRGTVDRRAGVPASSADTSLVAPAADAIDPGLLAAIEDGLEQKLVDEVRHRVVTELTRRLRS